VAEQLVNAHPVADRGPDERTSIQCMADEFLALRPGYAGDRECLMRPAEPMLVKAPTGPPTDGCQQTLRVSAMDEERRLPGDPQHTESMGAAQATAQLFRKIFSKSA
jgi:hypothetical protein